MKVIIAVIILAIICGCQNNSDSPTEITSHKLGVAFDLRIGETVSIQDEQLTIQFVNVPNDSRCPEGAVCVWAGNAVVELKVSNILDTLNTFVSPSELTSGIYTIRLLNLSPYPKIDLPRDTTLYVAQLVVTK